MAFAAGLEKAGFNPERVSTSAKVRIEKVGDGFKITMIELTTEAKVADIGEKRFQELADAAKKGCPVSIALAATEIRLNAKLVS